MLAAVFIGQGVDALRSPKPAADAARPTLEGLQKLPDPVGTKVPTDAETFAKVNAAVQIGGGLLLATGRLPRLASAALAATVIPANLGAHMFWSEVDPERKLTGTACAHRRQTEEGPGRHQPAGRFDHRLGRHRR